MWKLRHLYSHDLFERDKFWWNEYALVIAHDNKDLFLDQISTCNEKRLRLIAGREYNVNGHLVPSYLTRNIALIKNNAPCVIRVLIVHCELSKIW